MSRPTASHEPVDRLPSPLRFLARYRGWIAVGVLCLVVTNLLAQSIPWIVKRTIEALGQDASAGRIGRLALLIVACATGQALIRVLSRVFIFNAGREAEYEIRSSLFARLVRLDAAFYRRYPTGELMSRLTNDLSAVRAMFGPGILHAANTVFAYAVALPLMLRIDARLTLLALLPYPFLMLGARTFARGIYARSSRLQAAMGRMTSDVQEDLAGIRELKSYQLERLRADRFAEGSREYRDQAVGLAAWRSAMLPVVGVGASLSLVLVLWMGGRRVMQGSLTLGDLVALNLYVASLAWPTLAIGWMVSIWQRGAASWQRLAELFGARSALSDGTNDAPTDGATDPALATPRAIELRGLSVTLAERPVLQDLRFEVPAGTLCAVVGRVGSGKSTLAEALARLLPVPTGTLFVGGQDVNALPVAALRRSIAYAPQDPFLFSLSIAENIAHGLGGAVDASTPEARDRILLAAHAAGLENDLGAFPEGIDTVVGERGVTLSGGQRQRVALARALVARRPILILDDSLSAVDAETERQILVGLRDLLAGTTTFLVSHRLSALQHADQVVVLQEGRVVERGTPAELLARGGHYAQLYERQRLAHEVGLDEPAGGGA